MPDFRFSGVGIGGSAITLTYALAHTAPPRLKMAPKKEVKKIAPKLTDAEKKKIKQANKEAARPCNPFPRHF